MLIKSEVEVIKVKYGEGKTVVISTHIKGKKWETQTAV